MTSALAAAHARDLVHRDIKPENVMVRPDGYVKVLDFGLAKLARRRGAVAASTWRRTPGIRPERPAYMSPEQARAEPVDARTDVFSVGALLYEMVTGRLAFSGDCHAVIFAGILGDTPPAPPESTRPCRRSSNASSPRASRRTASCGIRARPTCARICCACAASPMPARRRSHGGKFGRHKDGGRLFSRPAARRLFPGPCRGLLAAIYTFQPQHESRAASAAAARTMLAVLPFENLGEDERQEYFADGLTEELTAQLGQLQPAKLGVIARTSTVRYKQTKASAAQIGRELGVDYLLEGSVRRAGERVRVIAQLVDASKQTRLWSETYERPVIDVLHIQTRNCRPSDPFAVDPTVAGTNQPAAATPSISRAMTSTSWDCTRLAKAPARAERRRSSTSKTRWPRIRGRADPCGARPDLHGGQHVLQLPTEVMPLARDAALRALALDPELAIAHVTLGYVRLLFDWDWPAAEHEYRKALEINPNLPEPPRLCHLSRDAGPLR